MLALFGINMGSVMFVALPIAGSMLLVYGLYQIIFDLKRSNRNRMMDRLTESGGKGKQNAQDRKDSLLRKRILEEHSDGLDSFIAKLSVVPKIQLMLDQANIDWSASRALLNLLGITLLAGCLPLVMQQNPWTGVITGTVTFVFPIMVLKFIRKRRLRKLVEQLPDVFELLSQALRAGHSLASGIHLIHDQMPDPAGTEFGRVFFEQNLGIKMEEALTNMANRMDQLDVRLFVTAVLIQRQTGGDLAEILDKIGTVIRDRIHLFGTVAALTAEGRLSGWVLLALPILVFLVELHLNPSYANVLLYTPDGKMLLYTAVGMNLMGLALIRKIVNIKV